MQTPPQEPDTGAEQGPSEGQLPFPPHSAKTIKWTCRDRQAPLPPTPPTLQRNRVELPVSRTSHAISLRECWPLNPLLGQIPEVRVVQQWESSGFQQVVQPQDLTHY